MTQKPIATISYNTEPFLKEKLDLWYSQHIIQAYMYIKHIGEDGDKDHIHLRIEPNKKLDPMELSELLKEYPAGAEKPLGVRPWRSSKEEDWILYSVHDPEYLKLKYSEDKGEKLPYEWQQIVVSEGYDMQVAFIRARAAQKHGAVNLMARMQQGANPFDLVMEGENVFTVNALMKTASVTDYTRLAQDHDKLQDSFDALLAAVDEAGFAVVADSEGHIHLEKKELPVTPSAE